MIKKKWLTLISIMIIVIAFFLIIYEPKPETPENLVECIAENSILYTQLGCHACETQEKLFGDNYNKLNIVDCFYEKEKCLQENITATPTWIINGEKIIGTKEIEELKILTNCQ